MKHIGFVIILSIISVTPALGQTRPTWPDIKLSGCPVISPPRSLNERTWKHGEAEQNDFQAAGAVQDRKQAVEILISFASKYPDSDYRELALIFAMGIGASLKDMNLQSDAAKVLVQAPTGEATALVAAFVTLNAGLSPYVHADDPEEMQKLADLETWTTCGREALAAQIPPTDGQLDTYEKSRLTSESVLARTAGFIALERHDYATAGTELKKAASDNPQDALTFLWLSTTELSGDNSDLNAGLFYLARAEQLSPQVPQFASVLKQSYVTVHGSEKGLEKLQQIARSNTAPPLGLNILPKPKKERHYGTAIAATAIVGLLVYGAVAHPDFMTALGQSVAGGQSTASGTGKLIVFAGSSHETYLGCLNCAETAPDSISNEYGQNGSRYSQTSIWNHYSEFGSPYQPYSACNPYSTDPPVIVDDAGIYYGRLTVNQFHPELGAGRQLINWLKQVVCSQ
jgi:hypothetical protein